jgi:phenylpropionate dioxygenase-like ring-hydroxylating dioxygenase large terminal subunit
MPGVGAVHHIKLGLAGECTARPVFPRKRTSTDHPVMSRMGHVWTAPAVQEESDVSAKRSGAVMYPACFRLEDCLLRDAAAMAAGPDVIR